MAYSLAKLLLACYVASAGAEVDDASVLLQVQVDDFPTFGGQNGGPTAPHVQGSDQAGSMMDAMTNGMIPPQEEAEAPGFPSAAEQMEQEANPAPGNSPLEGPGKTYTPAKMPELQKKTLKEKLAEKGLAGLAKEAKYAVGPAIKAAALKSISAAMRVKEFVRPTAEVAKVKSAAVVVSQQEQALKTLAQKEKMEKAASDLRVKASMAARSEDEAKMQEVIQETKMVQEAQDKVAPYRAESAADSLAKQAQADAMAAAPAQQVMAAMAMQKAAQEAQAAALEQEANNNIVFQKYMQQMKAAQVARRSRNAADDANTMAHIGEYGVYANKEERENGEWSALNPANTQYEIKEAMSHGYQID